MEKKNPDLRKEANQAIREVEGEVKGVILFATDCKKNVGLVAGSPQVLANMLAQAMMNDSNLVELIKVASALVAVNAMKAARED